MTSIFWGEDDWLRINCGIVDDAKDEFTDVLFKGRFYEWYLKEGTAMSPSPNISNSQVCFINNNRALVITRSVLLVDKQEI